MAETASDSSHEFVVVGGGTAGSLLAARLAERGHDVALIEWGPSDKDEPRARYLRRWAEMLEGEYDLDYRSEPNERGNSHIRLSRLRILGGCSTANTMIAWRPLASDLREWESLGAAGWGPDAVLPLYKRLQTPIQPVPPKDQNPFVADVVASAASALGVPVQDAWNDGRLDESPSGAGFFEVGYTPETGVRASTSIHYLHEAVPGTPLPTVLTGLRATEIVLSDDGHRATGVRVRAADGTTATVSATREVVLCAGAIDTPRLLQLSGIGPRDVLESAGVPVRHELPGVGANLQDHVEGLIVWEARRTPPDTCASGWDAGAMISDATPDDRPDILMHFPVEPWAVHADRYRADHGQEPLPPTIISIAPNVARPLSRGRTWITSADPDVPPAIDYRSFSDAEGRDERLLVEGVRRARVIAREEPMRSWVGRELFPGAEVEDEEELSAILRDTHQTVYHVSGTCRIGAPDDPAAVVDPALNVRGIAGLRIADASVFPTLTATNPVVTVMLVAERAADLITETIPTPEGARP
ncbi:GMC family oxidoreductase [Branchiibius sp. NY16-3462-2]|uniref:GMC family oxidoreductase n=1 Tax=Branchiibius sp. NY16-3462-2 TaxID=1807500 RepID=UPI000796E2FD|nr:GMC family oxidoreductase N-terminal domain-containing protein [Branchiibius sp. NY16-3462-2]KYH45208.1 choline oxidase [Branchiibius sp. NY16-3462-2]